MSDGYCLRRYICFFFQAEDGIRDLTVTGVQTCALPIYGTHEARFDLNTIVFGDNGKIVGRQMQTVAFRVGAKRYDRTLHEGVIYPFDLPVQQSGTLQFRVAILDKNSQKIGSAGQSSASSCRGSQR